MRAERFLHCLSGTAVLGVGVVNRASKLGAEEAPHYPGAARIALRVLAKILVYIIVAAVCLFIGVIVLFAVVYRDRRPAIYFATEKGDTNAIALYLSSGSNVNAIINCYPFGGNVDRAPLIDVAIQKGRIETVEFLLRQGANPNEPDIRGHPPLFWVLGRTSIDNDEMRARLVKLLLKAGASLNAPAKSEYGYTPLIEAASLGEADMVRMFLDAGADVNGTNADGQTALTMARWHTNAIPVLLAAGADPNAKDKYGNSPIDYAIRDHYTNSLALLTNANKKTHR